MQKLVFLTLLSTLFVTRALCQETVPKSKQEYGLIIGNVMDAATLKPVSYATVTLITSSDTAKRFVQVADKNGAFEFEKVAFAVYSLAINSVGYKSLMLDSINIRAERFDFNLGDIKVTASSSDLTEVIVYSEKPLIENRDGKLIYNVGESALSNSSSTAEILKSMPLINNDPNGKILLKGKEPKILIDDKPTDLTTEQLKDLLESLPGSSIEKIELMVNPPPEYATESGGVINIVTKKGKVGLTGRVTINAGTRGDGNLAANISYRKQRVSYTTTLGMGGSILTGNSYSRRESFYTDSSNKFNTEGNYKNKNLRPNLRFQVDYEINKFRNISFTYQGNINLYHNNSFTQYTNINRYNQPYKYSSRENDTEGDGYNHGLTFGYTVKSKKTVGAILRLIINGNVGKNDNDRDFFQQFVASNFITYGDSSQNQFANVYSNTYSARINYDRPLSKLIFFSTGATYQRSNFHSILNTSFLRKLDSTFVANDLLSNDFKHHQSISTVRVAATINLPKDWKIIAGVQAEHTQMDFVFLKGNTSDVANNYVNFLPAITIRKDFNKQLNTALIYRATIRRPGLGELNPNVDYGDPYNLRFGNPFLLPTLADNFDWNFSLIKGKYYINTSVGYNKIKNIFNTIRTLNADGKTQVTWQNIADRNEYEASIWGGYSFSKKVRMNISAGYSYNQYGEAEKILYKYIDGSTFYTGLNYSYTPSTTLIFDGNARYSSYATPQGRSRSSLSMNIGVQKKLFNKRLIVAFNVLDPFLMQQSTTFTYGVNYNLESFNSTNTRNFRFSISYQLNKMVQKRKLSEKEKKAILDKIKQKKVS